MRVLLLLISLGANGADWPAFRGPNANGVSEATGLPTEFGPQKNMRWKLAVPPGRSSPVWSGARLYLTAYEKGELLTYAVDRETGKVLWRRSVPQPRTEALHQLNTPASPTPVTDGQNVYAFFPDFGVISYGPDGNERWRIPLGPFQNLHGMAASPVLAGNKLILVCDQDSESFLLVLDKDSGRTLWRKTRDGVVHGFATPTVYQPASGPSQILVPGSYQLAAYALEDGRELWFVRGLSWQIKTTAVLHGDVVYTTGWAPGGDPGEAKPIPAFADALKEADANGDGQLASDELPQPWKHGGSWMAIDLNRDGFLNAREWGFYRGRRSASNVTMAVKLSGAKGDVTDTHVLWKHQRFVPQVSSPLYLNGHVYTVKDGGILTSMDAATGEIRKTGRVAGAIGAYYASPIAADGKIFLLSEAGQAAVLHPGLRGEWEVMAVNELGDSGFATPAVADGRLYVRTGSILYCFEGPLAERRAGDTRRE